MQNDIGEGLDPLGLTDLENVKSLWKFQVSRAQAESWAFRDMRFLVFDDSSLDYDSDNEDAMMQRALRLSTQVEGDEAKPEILEYTPKGFDKIPEGEQPECRVCAGIPEFPIDKKTRFFRLFRPADILPTLLENRAKYVDVCTHYVAVSYCWPEKEIKERGSSVVRDLDGRVRPARALDDVLDRAVDFANSCGLRMIWIDQECLPQPTIDSPQEDFDYQRIGVQAMDIVYNRAMVTAGLHDGTIETQRQADAIRRLLDYGTRVPNLSQQFFDDIFNFLETIISDRWYTRTWVIQEAVSAGNGLMLAFRRGKGVRYPTGFRDTEKHTSRPPTHSLDADPSKFKSDLIMMNIDEFRGMVRSARALLQRTFWSSGEVLIRERRGRFPILDIVESLHPKVGFSNQIYQLRGANQYGKRQRVNATTALSFLKTRDCKYQEDRITVLANMCSYEIRLDACEIAKHCDSVRIGILSLALLNGDTSILVPEVYSFPDSEFREADGSNRSILSPYDTDPGMIADYTMMKGHLQMPRLSTHTFGANLTKGLRLPAYMWAVEREIDCLPLKEKFAETWHSMKCIRAIVTSQKDESWEAFQQRERRIHAHFSVGGRMKIALWEIFRLGYLPRDSIVWAGLDPDGIEWQTYLDADRVKSDPNMCQAFAEIFFAILLYLKTHSDTDAAGLANSIWQSVRVDMVDRARQDLPDEVNDALFNHTDVVETPFKTLKLDADGIGGFRQTWFIDRIMQNGCLWIGKYERRPVLQSLLSRTIQSFSESPPSSPGVTHNMQETNHDLAEFEPDAGQGPSSEQGNLWETPFPHPVNYSTEIPISVGGMEGVSFRDGGEETLLRQQFLLHMTATTQSVNIFRLNLNNVPPYFNAGSVAHYLRGKARGIWTAEAEENRVKNLVSAFDVDGPCTVATPFNSEWEVLPHPDIRAMSACWVVDPVESSKEQENPLSNVDYDGHEEIKMNREGDGENLEKTDQDEISSPERVSSKGKGKEKVKDLKAEILRNGKLLSLPEPEDWPQQMPLYRVVHKVKGVWQLMDLPLQEFCFI